VVLLAHKYKLIAAAVIFYFVLLIANLPAAQVIHRLPLPANIYLNGVGGTVWNGSLQTVIANGIQVNNVRWQASFWSLLFGSASVDIQAGNKRNPDNIALNGQVNFSLLSQQLQLEETELQLPASLVMSQLRLPLPVQASGRFTVDLQTLNFNLKAMQCETAEGEGHWLNATVVDRGNVIDFGQYDATIACVEQNLQFTVQPNNLLNLDAVATLQNTGKFKVTARFKPAATMPESVHNAAQMFGRKDSQGFISVSM